MAGRKTGEPSSPATSIGEGPAEAGLRGRGGPVVATAGAPRWPEPDTRARQPPRRPPRRRAECALAPADSPSCAEWRPASCVHPSRPASSTRRESEREQLHPRSELSARAQPQVRAPSFDSSAGQRALTKHARPRNETTSVTTPTGERRPDSRHPRTDRRHHQKCVAVHDCPEQFHADRAHRP